MYLTLVSSTLFSLVLGQAPPATGSALPGLTTSERSYFEEGLNRFREVDSVIGTEPGANGVGLGPRFNSNSCVSCHAHPQTGGSAPAVNPQLAVAARFGARNLIPSFLTARGPVRVARFKQAPNGADGGVQNLFVITGRGDAGNCNITQPDFDEAVEKNNVVFRIPIPLFGAGLVEAIPDSVILANKIANGQLKNRLGISGRENRSANDGVISRFGWKAQNVSLMMFSGEAYNVEQGVTNEMFPTERDQTPGCQFNASPEDHTNLDASVVLESMSDLAGFTSFMKFLAPPARTRAPGQMEQLGQMTFDQIGCGMCHTPNLTTGASLTLALNKKAVPLFSDLLLHKMGRDLNDGIRQGNSAEDEWRTAPLWGLGQRLFFLHDGRTTDLNDAIRTHASQGSEANQVISSYNALPDAARQALLAFLKSL